MEGMKFLKDLLAEMNANMNFNQEQTKETMDRQTGSLVSRMEADRDEIKQEILKRRLC
jgi:hypothetical protein